ncbi:Syntaxin [Popillia japonica]|uniref:Syntaxin n=1 Tax=Popillia japonica TaxID=7064 RepID=A0AAW1JTM4_POPJA
MSKLHYKDENEKSKDKKKKMNKPVKDYLDECEVLRQKINEIKNDTQETNYILFNKHFYKFEDLRNEVTPIIKRSENACTKIHNTLKGMAIERDELEKESSAEIKMKYMQYTTLREEFQDAINGHIECVKRYEVLLEEIKKRIQQSIQGENYDESEEISNETQAFIGNYLIEKHTAELQLRDVQERHHQLLEIENQLVELRELFVKIAILVEQQQESINRAEHHAAISSRNVESANEELVKAKGKKSTFNKMRMYLIIGGIVLAIIILILIFK